MNLPLKILLIIRESKMLNKFILLVTTFFFYSWSYADCSNAFECINLGDEAIEDGNLTKALEYYKSSCDQGFSAGCKSFAETTEKSKTLKNDFTSPLGQKVHANNIINQCTSKVSSKPDDCLNKASELRKKGLEKAAIEIQQFYCDKEISKGCFELGITMIKKGDQENARKAYLTACSLGDTKACDVSRSLSTNIEVNESRVERERKKKQEEIAEERRIERETQEQQAKRNQAIIEGFQQIGRGISGTKSDAELDRELKEEQLNSLRNRQPNNSNSFNNKRKCTTKPSAFGNSLETTCEDSF